MSKLTEVLKLFCYDPETDGNLTFNVTEALTKNWEKIDQLVLLAVAAAAAYDTEGSYAVGDYTTHGGKLHKCSTPIESGEAWNAAHWTETSVAAELAEVRASLSNKAEWNGGFLQKVSILEWAEKRGIHAVNTHVSTNETVTDVPYTFRAFTTNAIRISVPTNWPFFTILLVKDSCTGSSIRPSRQD